MPTDGANEYDEQNQQADENVQTVFFQYKTDG
jgi:hypothetical protein